MTDAPREPGSPSPTDSDALDDDTPRGTLFTLMVYIMVLAGMWGVLYWTMVTR